MFSILYSIKRAKTGDMKTVYFTDFPINSSHWQYWVISLIWINDLEAGDTGYTYHACCFYHH